MPLAWYRLACWRDAPKAARTRLLLLAPAIVVALSAIALLLVLTKSFYLGDDSAHSYAHVWYLSEAIFTHHQWPWHVSQLENGKAVMFPYGIIPWLPDALLYPILGEWVVTLSMVVGVLLMLAGVVHFRPAMRSPVLFAIFLLNPLLWNGITQFQLTTMWSFAFFFFGAGQFERKHNGRAAVLFALAVATHPMMGACALAFYTVWEVVRLRTLPRRLLLIEAIAVVVASPAIVLFLQTPSIADADRTTIALSTLDNLRRLSIILIPLALPPLAQLLYRRQRWFVAIGALSTAGVLVLIPPTGLWQTSQPRFAAYLQQYPIDPQGSYRVAVPNNHEDGMVQFMKAGAVLSNEFFTESEYRQVWPSEAAYTCFLATKNIDHVVISGEYGERFRSSETGMLEALASSGYAQQQFRGSDGTVAYTVQPPASARRASIRECHI